MPAKFWQPDVGMGPYDLLNFRHRDVTDFKRGDYATDPVDGCCRALFERSLRGKLFNKKAQRAELRKTPQCR